MKNTEHVHGIGANDQGRNIPVGLPWNVGETLHGRVANSRGLSKDSLGTCPPSVDSVHRTYSGQLKRNRHSRELLGLRCYGCKTAKPEIGKQPEGTCGW